MDRSRRSDCTAGRWKEKLAGGPQAGTSDPPLQGQWEWVDNNNLMIVLGILVCSSFLISGCMFIVWKALLISSATVIVRTGGAISLNPFATVLFTVCSTVTVACCVLYPCCVGVFGMLCLCNY